jgi:hypothetical protein
LQIRGMTITCFVAIYSYFRQCSISLYISRVVLQVDWLCAKYYTVQLCRAIPNFFSSSTIGEFYVTIFGGRSLPPKIRHTIFWRLATFRNIHISMPFNIHHIPFIIYHVQITKSITYHPFNAIQYSSVTYPSSITLK